MTELSKSRAREAGRQLAKEWTGDIELDHDELLAAIYCVQEWRRQHAYPLSLTTPTLRRWVERESDARPIPVAQRLKQYTTIVVKLVRHPTMSLIGMQDIAGCRAILPELTAVDRVASRIHRHWTVLRDDDYREKGRPMTGYRARHLIVLKHDRRVEIQLRTTTEHRWAETVVSTGERLGYALKDGDGPADLVEYFRLASDMLWLIDRDRPVSTVQRERFSELREAVRQYFAPRT